MSKNPSATFGNTKRILIGERSSRLNYPGPGDYRTNTSTNNGPNYHIAQKYNSMKDNIPGPSDYNPLDSLKKMPRPTIGHSKKVSCLEPREKSPGPQEYEPKRLQWKKRASAAIFNREKRHIVAQK